MSPFQALYRRAPPVVLHYVRDSTNIHSLNEILLVHNELLKILKSNLLKAQHRMSQIANKKWREVDYEVGDFVWLRLQPFRQKVLISLALSKL